MTSVVTYVEKSIGPYACMYRLVDKWLCDCVERVTNLCHVLECSDNDCKNGL